MKNWMIMLFLLFAPSVFAELTPEDILTISGIVEKSENRMQAYIDKSEERMQAYIDKSEERMQASIDNSGKQTRGYIDTKLTGTEGKLTGKIDGLEGRMDGTDRNITLVVALVVGVMALIVLAVGIPQLILISRQRNQNIMEKKLETMENEMQQIRKELALLLEDRVVKS